jgi:hypothetical protein
MKVTTYTYTIKIYQDELSSYLTETQRFQFTRINRLILFSIIIAVYSDTNTKNNEQRDVA